MEYQKYPPPKTTEILDLQSFILDLTLEHFLIFCIVTTKKAASSKPDKCINWQEAPLDYTEDIKLNAYLMHYLHYLHWKVVWVFFA